MTFVRIPNARRTSRGFHLRPLARWAAACLLGSTLGAESAAQILPEAGAGKGTGAGAIRASEKRSPVKPLNLGAMIQPFSDRNIFREPDHFVWCPQVFQEPSGAYYLIYSRWPRTSRIGGWLTESEVVIAAGKTPDGPFHHVKTLLRGAGPGHWDELMAHNPKLYRFGGNGF